MVVYRAQPSNPNPLMGTEILTHSWCQAVLPGERGWWWV